MVSAALPAASRIARAQTYSTKYIMLVVAVAASAPPDVYARLVATALSDILGQRTSGGRPCG